LSYDSSFIDLPESSGSCQKIRFEWMGYGFDVPSDTMCDNLATFREYLSWLLYIVTAFGSVEVVLSGRGKTA
jgi:hypothetical protein